MILEYMPILKAKQGEFNALKHTTLDRKRVITPVFEIIPPSDNSQKTSNSGSPQQSFFSAPLEEHLLKANNNIVEATKGCKSVFLDITHWQLSHIETESGQHVLDYIFSDLQNRKCVNIYPVVNFDFWEGNDIYQNVLSKILDSNSDICIRFNSGAIEDSQDTKYLEKQLNGIFTNLSVKPHNCSILIDFEFNSSVDMMIEKFEYFLESLNSSYNFKYFILAGCSIPKSISDITEKDTCATITRTEMIAYKKLYKKYSSIPLIFGDYGIQHPKMLVNKPNPNANCKIRYTVPERYFITRGHSRAEGFSQFQGLAQNIINSNLFFGKEFSWGDKRIGEIANNPEKPGNLTTWISIDTNHHVSVVLSELVEFKKQLLPESTIKQISK